MLKTKQTVRVFRYIGDRIIDECRRKSYRVLAASKLEHEDGVVSNTGQRTDHKPTCETDNRKSDAENRKYRADNRKCDIDNRKAHNVYTTYTPNRVHINLEELTADMQDMFWRGYKDELETIVNNNEINRISFNSLSEDVYRYQVNMPVRKLGYTSTFQRYNENRGLADFILIEKK